MNYWKVFRDVLVCGRWKMSSFRYNIPSKFNMLDLSSARIKVIKNDIGAEITHTIWGYLIPISKSRLTSKIKISIDLKFRNALIIWNIIVARNIRIIIWYCMYTYIQVIWVDIFKSKCFVSITFHLCRFRVHTTQHSIKTIIV